MSTTRRYWVMKSEPDVFSFDDLVRLGREHWDGVRNYQARNMLRDEFRAGDRAFFHHSSCEVPGIYGTMEIVRGGHPDPSQFDRKSTYYDPGSDPENPRWYQVEVRLVKKFARPVTLDVLRGHAAGALADLIVLRRGNRLSVMPVTAGEWKFIHRLAREAPR
jgi:predicted RNA-binding protein with PUA-like domain